MSYGVGHRPGSNLVWLWLWCRPAAIVLIRPLAWELPYAAGIALKSKKKKRKEKKEETNTCSVLFVFFLLGPHPWHMEVPRLEVESEV